MTVKSRLLIYGMNVPLLISSPAGTWFDPHFSASGIMLSDKNLCMTNFDTQFWLFPTEKMLEVDH